MTASIPLANLIAELGGVYSDNLRCTEAKIVVRLYDAYPFGMKIENLMKEFDISDRAQMVKMLKDIESEGFITPFFEDYTAWIFVDRDEDYGDEDE